MNSLTHFLVSFDISYLLFHNYAGLAEIALFSFIFSVLVDADVWVLYAMKKGKSNLRTWMQEPLGLAILGLPIGLILSVLFKPIYLLLVIIPYSLHIVMDYLTIHLASPLSPVDKKPMEVGFVLPFPKSPEFREKFMAKSGISEIYITVIALITALVILF
jgi:hypothetical protein